MFKYEPKICLNGKKANLKFFHYQLPNGKRKIELLQLEKGQDWSLFVCPKCLEITIPSI